MNAQQQPSFRPTASQQGMLFASLPRQLPVLKSGPEDEPKPVVKH